MNINVEITTRDRFGRTVDIIGYGSRGEVLYHDLCKQGRKYIHEYNENGFVTKSVASNGKITTYEYREGTDYISKRIIFEPTSNPNHTIVEYVRGNSNRVYQYDDDELRYIREYEEDDMYDISKKYSGDGVLETIKYKYKGTSKIRRIIDNIRHKDLRYIYNEEGKVIKVTNNRDIITRYIYNDEGLIDRVMDYKYDDNGKFIEVVTNQYHYKDGRLFAISIDGKLITSYTYKQL